jgi:glycosyltransferase involved in cell wall biosynthesis
MSKVEQNTTTNSADNGNLRILVVAENASERMGGEAILPIHYFRRLRARGYDVHLLTHGRVHAELKQLFPNDWERLHCITESKTYVRIYHGMNRLPGRIGRMVQLFVFHTMTQFAQRSLAKRLIRQYHLNVVHEPEPVSPKMTSAMYGLGAPVVIGPMNGGMTYAPAFRNRLDSLSHAIGRLLANIFNYLIPGKLRAHTLLVANTRTRDALPSGVGGRILELVENGVDLSVWHPACEPISSELIDFVFIGRLDDVKRVDLLLRAFKAILPMAARLTIIGEGDRLAQLKQLTSDLDLIQYVSFAGYLPQAQAAAILQRSHALILPSVRECGGAVILEAMATGIPVIATNWGGPADYLDHSCGILVDPTSEVEFTANLTTAMQRIATDSEIRAQLSRAAMERVRLFDWERKIDQMVEIYRIAASDKSS